MARPVKSRMVEFLPTEYLFMPMGKPRCEVLETTLQIDELEALRLKDLEELSQEECAKFMQVSRATFQNIIDSAHKKVAAALTEGKAIRIGGGSFTTKQCRYKCTSCGKLYEINFERDKGMCPHCKSIEVSCSKKRECQRCCNAAQEQSIPEETKL